MKPAKKYFMRALILSLVCLFILGIILLPQRIFAEEISYSISDDVARALVSKDLGPVFPYNPLKYAIRNAVTFGIPATTVVLLLLLPAVAAVIAAARNLVGIRGFGIFLPAALSVVFVATGPILGIVLFLVIVIISTFVRLAMRALKLKLQYLPRMAMILWFVAVGVLGVLFLAPVLYLPEMTNISIFAVLVLALLVEDFTRVQMGKSVRTAVELTSETLILSLVAFFFMTLKPLQEYALIHPELYLLSVLVFDTLLSRYSGLRLLEVWRFRKLIASQKAD